MRRGAELAAWIASLPAGDRDRVVEDALGIGSACSAPPGDHLIGHHASGVDAILAAVAELPIRSDDVVVDLGSGLGKAAILIALLTGARVRGIEIQEDLVHRARACAARLGARVDFVHGDVRTCAFDDATVLYLYCPFEGPVLAEIAQRMNARVCALGVDLDRLAPQLCRRPSDSFWLALYGRKRTE